MTHDDATTSSSHVPLTSPSTADALKQKLTEVELKKKEEITQRRAHELGLPYLSLKAFPIGPDVLSIIPKATAASLNIIPFFKEEGHIRCGVVHPNVKGISELLDQLRTTFTASDVELFLISPHSFDLAFELYKTIPTFKASPTGINISGEDLERFQTEMTTFAELEHRFKEANMTEGTARLVAGAMNAGSSDIHIEPEESGVVVRFRIDGLLQVVARLDRSLWPRLISRIKELAGLKINVGSVPQDGRITVKLTSGDAMDIRVSTLPSSFGESVVMRLLRSTTASLNFEDLGLRPSALKVWLKQIERPNGMIITTGPTGSGKTTTLYAVLNTLNHPDVKIITLEDPIEYKLKGLTQSQIEPSKGYTFAKGLRSILRQDPDIVMVGEMRDAETVDTAIQAALTGHLVISTIHTNDAAGAIPRFLSMGAKPHLLAPALNVIMGQRLVRRLCSACKKEITLNAELLERVKKSLGALPKDSGEKVDLDHLKFYGAGKCDACHQLGYKGRIGIYELLPMNREIEEQILSGDVSEYAIRDIGARHGMMTMAQDGLLKALDGVTSVDEVFRVTE